MTPALFFKVFFQAQSNVKEQNDPYTQHHKAPYVTVNHLKVLHDTQVSFMSRQGQDRTTHNCN